MTIKNILQPYWYWHWHFSMSSYLAHLIRLVSASKHTDAALTEHPVTFLTDEITSYEVSLVSQVLQSIVIICVFRSLGSPYHATMQENNRMSNLHSYNKH